MAPIIEVRRTAEDRPDVVIHGDGRVELAPGVDVESAARRLRNVIAQLIPEDGFSVARARVRAYLEDQRDPDYPDHGWSLLGSRESAVLRSRDLEVLVGGTST